VFVRCCDGTAVGRGGGEGGEVPADAGPRGADEGGGEVPTDAGPRRGELRFRTLQKGRRRRSGRQPTPRFHEIARDSFGNGSRFATDGALTCGSAIIR
jgi:hypothetical protein